MPPLTAESANLQLVTVPVALVAWGAVVGLGKVNPRAAGPAWWAAALGSLGLGLALLPWAALRSPVPPVLQALLGFGALLAALEGMLRFRRWPGEARRWPFGLALLVLVVALAWPWPAGVTWPDRALDGLHAFVLGAWPGPRSAPPPRLTGRACGCRRPSLRCSAPRMPGVPGPAASRPWARRTGGCRRCCCSVWAGPWG